MITLEEIKGRFEEWRSQRKGKARIPAELWSAAVEVARKEGVNRTARELHVAWDDLKRRLAGAKEIRQTPPAAFVELVPPGIILSRMHNRTGRPPGQTANPLKRRFGFRSGNTEPGFVGDGILIQIAPQLRILVAVEPIDGRKGMDAIAQLCREKLDADPFSGYLFIFRTRRGTALVQTSECERGGRVKTSPMV